MPVDRGRGMAFITVSMFLNSLGFTIILPVIPFLVARYVPAAQVGLFVGIIIAAYSLCQFVAAPALGALSDRFGRRPILLVSLLGTVVGYVIFGIGGALWILFVGRIIDGLTGGNISTMFSYVADISEPKDRGRLYGRLGAAGGFGFVVGPAVGGIVAQVSLSAPLFLAAGVTLLNVCWGILVLPESLPSTARSRRFDRRHLNPFSALSTVLRTSTLRILFLLAFLFFVAGTSMQATISVFLRDVLAFGPAGVGGVLFMVGIMDIVTQGYLTGRLLPRVGERSLATIGLAINGLGFLLIASVAVVPSVALLVIAVLVFTLGDGLFQPSASSMISNAAGGSIQGRIQGANQGMQSVARVVGPLIGAGLYTVGAGVPYVAGAALIAVACTVLLSAGTQLLDTLPA
jgi:DHA1 family tetracycline resistance protein-like MFS transporter